MDEKPAQPNDTITRYVYSKNDYSSNGVKHSAFMPPGSHPNELSVCIINELSEDDIWKMGQQARTDKMLKARGDLAVSSVLEISDEQGNHLKVLIDGIPHLRHANIKHLPLEKSLQRAVATQLAQNTSLKIA